MIIIGTCFEWKKKPICKCLILLIEKYIKNIKELYVINYLPNKKCRQETDTKEFELIGEDWDEFHD